MPISQPLSKKASIIKCKTPDDAMQIEQTLAAKYNDKITIEPVAEYSPLLKTTRFFTTSEGKDLIHQQIMEQNQWLHQTVFSIDRIYHVPAKIPYKNIIAKCDIPTHNKCLQRSERLIFNFSECKIYEYVNILQCAKCSRCSRGVVR